MIVGVKPSPPMIVRNNRFLVLVGLVIAALASPAAAQVAPTPPATSGAPTIDSILQGAETTAPASAPSPAPSPAQSTSPGPAAPAVSPPASTAPPQVSSMSQAAMSQAYDSAIRGAAQSAQQTQGPLDGGWTVQSREGEKLYRLQFVDRGLGLGLAEGAWRDLKANARLQTSGFIANVVYDGAQLTLKFVQSDPTDTVLVTLKPSGSGWSGQLVRRGVATAIILRRG